MRKELGKTEEWLYVLTKGQDDNLAWYALDPVTTRWQRLPPMPVSVSEQTPFCGCAVGSVNGCLYVLGGISRSTTVNSVWRFDPVLNSWSEVSSMLANRAYSKTGVLDKKLYVVGGVESRRGSLYPLQTAEVYDPNTDVWSEVPSIPFSKAQMLHDAFLAEMLKPIATGMTCYNGRLCVTQSLCSWPVFYDAGGKVYDPETSLWGDMPSGMGEGWPARQAGTKLSVVVGVPVYDVTDSKSSYLLAEFHRKLHFITRDAYCNVTEKGNGDNKSADSVIWKVIASKDLGAAELVSCLDEFLDSPTNRIVLFHEKLLVRLP
ncbi:hypothetical protein HID58_025871 [Brassica napus]|uniref:Uncharacterized protein n=1 Tax=Brassica napus TaxID=3708 RepID=A0ABQ8CME3_BRANA|nr:hypothetical protein HID58_025871 [Brassica napus]